MDSDISGGAGSAVLLAAALAVLLLLGSTVTRGDRASSDLVKVHYPLEFSGGSASTSDAL